MLIEVNLDSHDYARETRFAKFTEFLFGKLIFVLLKLSPRTAVCANLDISGDFEYAIKIEKSNNAVIMNCNISMLSNDGHRSKD